MDCAVSAGGLLIHAHAEWPCAVCRPWQGTESHGFCLCIRCAHRLIFAVEAGIDGARELLADIADALVILEAQMLSRRGEMN